ncbi:hypothetical protein CHN50_13125 [Priestia aryabhattai]|uniref:TraR/DksA C4-type zinc finger protein n=1 Tax=Priestia flexa TaxID=86664 RepID=UPI000BA0CAAB|nr:TraR/DksA C4-type zinc finger protein [Priestia flexa]MDT2045095.1 TraR/DksA C4-type zinc finger protein [Priestia flexa]OZT12324.1 hypothetical protein CHN50_13125 [Priestia aryabhattai]
MISNKQLNQLREALLTEQESLMHQLKDNNDFGLRSQSLHDSTGELSSYDNHPGDMASEIYEREKDIALYEHTREELKEIKAALNAMETSSYGKCKTCGKDISFERLQAVPTTLYCKEHSPSQETSRQRPVEELNLRHPFGQYDLDTSGATEYDAEDSWQDVERYGTSESPSDFEGDISSYNDTYIEHDENVGYVEDYENFVGTDLYGKEIVVYPSKQHEEYEQTLDEEGIMTTFGDLPSHEKEHYTE